MNEIPAKVKVEKIIEVFSIPSNPPKGVRNSALNKSRGRLMQLPTWMLTPIYEAAVELESRREEKEMNNDETKR